MAGEVDPLSAAAAELAKLRARGRAIATNRFLTPASRVTMLRAHEAAMMVALRRWRELAGITPMAATSTSSRVGRYRTW